MRARVVLCLSLQGTGVLLGPDHLGLVGYFAPAPPRAAVPGDGAAA